MTPRLLLDESRLDRNIARAAERFDALGIALRPHLKTHKSVEIMRRQLAAGADGVTVATLREAEVAVHAGAQDVLVAFPPVGRWRLERVERLARRARLVVACTTADQVRALSEHGGSSKAFEFYWEVDCGARRLGTAPGELSAAKIASLAGLRGVRLAGIMTFPGHSYRAGSEAELRCVAAAEGEALAKTRDALSARGVDPGVMSGGSTPTAWLDEGKADIDEYRCGNYVFLDATQVALGTAALDCCALSIEATVIDRPAPDRIILDSGSKSMTAERMSEATTSFGLVHDHPELRIESLYEEHAICRVELGQTNLAPGDRVAVVPNHACTSANLHDRYVVISKTSGEKEWPLDARGWDEDRC